ncbi:MAG: PatB family C-S lyase [Dysgonamonadaceae bacterium]|jgi:cystathionine beta-lyase|nr:PatB family C-S lyase [Dysgonamonadaceae bacterium]
MKQYNFDEPVDRRGTNALKTDALQERFGHPDLIPLWVADMDFKCGDFILEALKARCDRGIFGYTMPSDAYYRAIIDWVEKNHGWAIEKEWISYIPGIVKGIAFVIMQFTRPDDKVIIQPPVYHPFRLLPLMHRRRVAYNPLIEENHRYRMDLDGLRRMIDEDCKLLILANPHNPVGITWDRETLAELAEICAEKNVPVISDEIHSDMALFGHRHLPFASVSEAARQNSITFMAPSKTFNTAGIVSSHSIIPNKQLREKFHSFLESCELNAGTIFSYVVTETAYNHGAGWRSQMLRYIEGNIQWVDTYLKENIPSIKAFIPDASFLVWLDCRELGLDQKALNALFVEKAGLALNDGEMFGEEGRGFMRMNIGCPRAVLVQALHRLKRALI